MARRRFLHRCVAAFVLLAGLPMLAHAAGGFQITLPVGTKNPSGLILHIDGRGIDANGYRPIAVEITPRGGTPLVADRQLRLVLEVFRYASDKKARVSQIIELPEGSTKIEATVLVPQAGSWTGLTVETYEGGEKLTDLSHKNFRWPNANGWSWTEARPALLLIDSHVPPRGERDPAVQAFQAAGADPSPTYLLPDIRPLLTIFPDINAPAGPPRGSGAAVALSGLSKISDTALLTLLAGRSRAEALPPAELPSRWIALSQYDVVVVSRDDLRRMAAGHAQQLAALRDWLSTGPLLIVYGAGPQFASLAEVERLLDLRPLPAQDGAGAADLRGWTEARPELNSGVLNTPFDDETGELSGSRPIRGAKQAAEIPQALDGDAGETTRPAGLGLASPFVSRAAQLGIVVAVASEDPFPGAQKDWVWLTNSVPESHWKWFRRTGFSMQRTNNDYWKFLIPGVGEAPVISFLLLVSLFAVAIGPVNYYFLRRARRLYLLLVTVPLGALLVTVGLFVFAVLSDGVSTRLRIRSYADLDQQTGRAAVWSRQSYYAAMAPSQGLVFPDDTVAFPVAYEPSARGQDRATLVVWDGDQQLKTGYVSSRTATQIMVCRAATTQARLVVDEGASAAVLPKIKNQLGTPILYVLLRDSRGGYFAGAALADKAAAALEPIDPMTASLAMRDLAVAVRPAEPRGYDPAIHNANLFLNIGPRFSRSATSDTGAGDPLMTRSLLEMGLASAIMPTQRSLLPGTYIAIVETSPLVLTGVPRAREEGSFHVLRGHYLP